MMKSVSWLAEDFNCMAARLSGEYGSFEGICRAAGNVRGGILTMN